MTHDPKPTITPEEMQRRREAVRQADANNRIEGIFRDSASNEIVEAYIRGEIEARDLVTVYLARQRHSRECRGLHPGRNRRVVRGSGRR
jgi:hypothetical protein